MATHSILSGNSVEVIQENSDIIKKIVVSNTVPQTENKDKLPDLLEVIDISGKFDMI